MWTLLFGSIVNCTSHLADNKALLIANSFGMLLFVFVSYRFLKIYNLKLSCMAQASRLNGDEGRETLIVAFNAFVLVAAAFLMLFDLYHQNILSAVRGGGLIQPAEMVNVSLYNNLFGFDFKIPSSKLFMGLVNVFRRIFNPMVASGKKPILSWTAYDLAGKYFTVVKDWFMQTAVMQPVK